MNNTYTSPPTTTDLELALAFYSVLVEQARRREVITYGQLVEKAKGAFPANEIVQNAIPVSVGRRLDFVREFTRQRQLPDLTSLVVNKGTGECGVGFTRNFDPAEAREVVFAFDWQDVSTEFSGAVAVAKKAAEPRKRLSEAQARQLMSDYYMANKASLPTGVRAHREAIVKLIMEGVESSEAFAEALRP
jgi:hypothetical protein